MRWAMLGGGLLLELLGTVWLLQGIGILLGSPMTGQPFWAVVGFIVAMVGTGLILLAFRRHQATV